MLMLLKWPDTFNRRLKKICCPLEIQNTPKGSYPLLCEWYPSTRRRRGEGEPPPRAALTLDLGDRLAGDWAAGNFDRA